MLHAVNLAYYSYQLLLDSLSYLLCSKLCWHNQHKPIKSERIIIMLLVLPIILSLISQSFHIILNLFSDHHLWFLFYFLNFYCVSDNDVVIHIVVDK